MGWAFRAATAGHSQAEVDNLALLNPQPAADIDVAFEDRLFQAQGHLLRPFHAAAFERSVDCIFAALSRLLLCLSGGHPSCTPRTFGARVKSHRARWTQIRTHQLSGSADVTKERIGAILAVQQALHAGTDDTEVVRQLLQFMAAGLDVVTRSARRNSPWRPVVDLAPFVFALLRLVVHASNGKAARWWW